MVGGGEGEEEGRERERRGRGRGEGEAGGGVVIAGNRNTGVGSIMREVARAGVVATFGGGRERESKRDGHVQGTRRRTTGLIEPGLVLHAVVWSNVVRARRLAPLQPNVCRAQARVKSNGLPPPPPTRSSRLNVDPHRSLLISFV